MRVSGWALLLVMAAGSCGAVGQQAGGSAFDLPATSVAGVLRSLASRAGVVFVGQVERIEPKDGVVEITFLVQQPVMGVVGGTYVEREWAGRWSGGQQRYWVGQRALFFLYAPSTAGLSSTVDGTMGMVPLVLTGAKADPLLDVRMLAARVVRRVGSPIRDAGLGAITLTDGKSVVRNWRVENRPEIVMRSLPVAMPKTESSVEQQGAPDAQR